MMDIPPPSYTSVVTTQPHRKGQDIDILEQIKHKRDNDINNFIKHIDNNLSTDKLVKFFDKNPTEKFVIFSSTLFTDCVYCCWESVVVCIEVMGHEKWHSVNYNQDVKFGDFMINYQTLISGAMYLQIRTYVNNKARQFNLKVSDIMSPNGDTEIAFYV